MPSQNKKIKPNMRVIMKCHRGDGREYEDLKYGISIPRQMQEEDGVVTVEDRYEVGRGLWVIRTPKGYRWCCPDYMIFPISKNMEDLYDEET